MSLSVLRAFDATRALQAAAVLLRRQRSRQLSVSRLLALLYFADRESVAETGRPIVGGQLRATNRGPLLETMSRLIRGEHVESPSFARFLARDNYLLQLVEDPGNGSLSRYEIAKLNAIAQRFDANDDWEVIEAAMALPELQRAAGTTEISAEHILEAIGRGHEIATILEEAASDAKAAAFFASPALPSSSSDIFGTRNPV
jgi:hypothetical protein